MLSCRIAGMGYYLPERVVTNQDITKYLDTTDEWIVERTGIKERRFAAPGEGTAQMGAEATRKAVVDAGWKLSDIEFVIFATLSPDHLFPGSGCYMQGLLDIPGIGVLDIRNQCSGFIYGLAIAQAFIATGQYKRILLVGSETHSHCLEDPKAPRDVAVLFGDGAAAVCLEATDGEGVMATVMHADGSKADALKLECFNFRNLPFVTPEDIQAGKHFPVMDGRQVFVRAVEGMLQASEEVLKKAGKKLDDIKLIVPHQANLRISEAVRKKLGVDPDRVFNNIMTRGNTTAASIPLAMAEAREAGKLNRGDLVLLLAFGSGFTWGGAVLRY